MLLLCIHAITIHTHTHTIQNFQCPVLLRELMVWCWQENPDDRPTGNEIIKKADSIEFSKLLDGIRLCDLGKVRKLIHIACSAGNLYFI